MTQLFQYEVLGALAGFLCGIYEAIIIQLRIRVGELDSINHTEYGIKRGAMIGFCAFVLFIHNDFGRFDELQTWLSILPISLSILAAFVITHRISINVNRENHLFYVSPSNKYDTRVINWFVEKTKKGANNEEHARWYQHDGRYKMAIHKSGLTLFCIEYLVLVLAHLLVWLFK